jgi:hypothetical protein
VLTHLRMYRFQLRVLVCYIWQPRMHRYPIRLVIKVFWAILFALSPGERYAFLTILGTMGKASRSRLGVQGFGALTNSTNERSTITNNIFLLDNVLDQRSSSHRSDANVRYQLERIYDHQLYALVVPSRESQQHDVFWPDANRHLQMRSVSRTEPPRPRSHIHALSLPTTSHFFRGARRRAVGSASAPRPSQPAPTSQFRRDRTA